MDEVRAARQRHSLRQLALNIYASPGTMNAQGLRALNCVPAAAARATKSGMEGLAKTPSGCVDGSLFLCISEGQKTRQELGLKDFSKIPSSRR